MYIYIYVCMYIYILCIYCYIYVCIISEFSLFMCHFNVICRELCWELCWNSRWEVSIDVIPYGKPCGATLAPGNAHAKSREESRSLQKGQFSTHHALGFVVTLLFLGSVKTHDSSEKINTQQHFFAVRLEMPGTGSVRELIVSCPFCPCFYLFVLDPFAPLWICAFPLSFSFSSSRCHRCHLLRCRWPSPSSCSFEHLVWKPHQNKTT